MCNHFRSYLRGVQFTMCTDHRSLQWLQKFRNSDGMLARWYMLLGQFLVTFEYCLGSQHANADGLSRQYGQCLRPDCLISHRMSPSSGPGLPQTWLNNLSPRRQWVICFRNYPVRRGWSRLIWMRPPVTCLYLTLSLIWLSNLLRMGV